LRDLPDDSKAEGIEVFHRRDMDTVQRLLREIKGTTVLVYEQTCASESDAGASAPTRSQANCSFQTRPSAC